MKSWIIMILLSIFLTTITAVNAENKKSHNGRSYGDAWYELEKKYPSPERRYSRKDLDQARRRANNSLWMEQWGSKDPIYRSDQYRGRSSGGYNAQPYRSNRFGHQW